MTVKELIDILKGCNQDATIQVRMDDHTDDLHESQVWLTEDEKLLILDLDYGDEE